jgi:enterochelin esterase-like enzyme
VTLLYLQMTSPKAIKLDAPSEEAYTSPNRRPRRLAERTQAGGVCRRCLLTPLLAVALAACGVPPIRPASTPATPASTTATPRAISTTTDPASPTASPRTIPADTPTPSCMQLGGRIEVGQAEDTTGKLLTYRVYTPPCFNVGSTPIPILILFHGLTSTDSQWGELGVGTQADELIRSSQVPPFLILMPREDTGLDLESAVMDTLLPLVEGTYDVGGDRSRRAIGGLSRGAGWALRIGLKHPDQFGSIGMDSPAVLSPDLFYLPSWTQAIPPSQMPRIAIDIGRDDTLLPATRELTSLLDDLNVKYDWHLNPGEHTPSYWVDHMADYLRWYAAGWPAASVAVPSRHATPTTACGCR